MGRKLKSVAKGPLRALAVIALVALAGCRLGGNALNPGDGAGSTLTDAEKAMLAHPDQFPPDFEDDFNRSNGRVDTDPNWATTSNP